jgi:dipeptidase E
MLYLPVAMNGVEPSYDACLAWVTSVFAPLGVTDIVMWTDLMGKTLDDVRPFSAVYIGGGNTFRLLHALRTSGVDRVLATYIADGGIVYGGSAGAIVLGADITTAAHADPNTAGLQDTRGLDVVDGCSIWCHFDPAQATRVETYARERAHPVIALSEDAGVVVEDATITALGTTPVVVFDSTTHVTVAPSSIVTLPPPRTSNPG